MPYTGASRAKALRTRRANQRQRFHYEVRNGTRGADPTPALHLSAQLHIDEWAYVAPPDIDDIVHYATRTLATGMSVTGCTHHGETWVPDLLFTHKINRRR